jgi:predicted porin
MQVGTKYSLSKRSTLWAAYGYSKFDTAAGANAGDKDHISGTRFGVTHTF